MRVIHLTCIFKEFLAKRKALAFFMNAKFAAKNLGFILSSAKAIRLFIGLNNYLPGSLMPFGPRLKAIQNRLPTEKQGA